MEIDDELIELIELLNKIPGLTTTSCCSGHNKKQLTVFFNFDSIEHLNNFMWAGCRRYFNINIMCDLNNSWTLFIDNSDTYKHSKVISLLLLHPKCENIKDKIDNLSIGIKSYLKKE